YKNGSDTLSKAIYLPRSLHVTAQSKQADQQYPDNSLTLRRASREASIQALNINNFSGVAE
ncbi:hypothetical protein, partial [Enterobacter kobei]|uniref:hypothetical protein n=2 Tax=Enterobacterales TaxID=91347 RepID=UPI001C26FAA6